MWSLASAKQQFSEVVRQAQAQPQAILRHNKEVAVLVSARDYAEFAQWRAGQGGAKTAGQLFLEGMDDIRSMLVEADPAYQGIELPLRTDRSNAVALMLDEEFPYGEDPTGLPAASALPKAKRQKGRH